MKQFVLAILLCSFCMACNSNTKSHSNPEVDKAKTEAQVYEGEFIFTEEAAVLKGQNFIYGVTKDSLAQVLAQQVALVKQDEFDMVPVILKGHVNPKPEGAEGWDQILTITKILEVSQEPAPADVKIEDSKN